MKPSIQLLLHDKNVCNKILVKYSASYEFASLIFVQYAGLLRNVEALQNVTLVLKSLIYKG